DDDAETRTAKVVHRPHVRRVRTRNDDDELVRREDDRLRDEPVVVQQLRVLRARGGVDVRRPALLDLERELVRPGEAVARRLVDPREDLRQRRGREDRDAAARRGGRRKQEDRDERSENGARHRSTMIDVDFTTAVAGTPRSRPSSATASAVTIAVISTGSVTAICTCASRPSTRTDCTTPGKRFRALSA